MRDYEEYTSILPASMLLAAVVLMCLPVRAPGQIQDEDESVAEVDRSFRFIGLKYGEGDQGGWLDDALAYRLSSLGDGVAFPERPVLNGVDTSGSLGVEGVFQLGDGLSGLHVTFERVVHEFTFHPSAFYWGVDASGKDAYWPGDGAMIELDQRTFGAAYVLIHDWASIRMYYGAGYALATSATTSVSPGRTEFFFNATNTEGKEVPFSVDVDSALYVEALFGLAVADADAGRLLDFLQSAARITDPSHPDASRSTLLGPDPPQPDGVYGVFGLLHTPGEGRFTWGGNIEYFADPELMNVNVLVGFRF